MLHYPSEQPNSQPMIEAVTVFHYDAASGEYLGQSVEHLPVGVGIPAHSCVDAPPTVKVGFVARRIGDTWQKTQDHRGKVVYHTATGEKITVTDIGPLPTHTTLLAPTSGFDTWDGQQWVTDTLAQQAAAIEEAEDQRQTLLTNAQAAIGVLQAKLMLARISDAEKNILNTWLDYIDTLNALDMAKAPAITWPDVPNVA